MKLSKNSQEQATKLLLDTSYQGMTTDDLYYFYLEYSEKYKKRCLVKFAQNTEDEDEIEVLSMEHIDRDDDFDQDTVELLEDVIYSLWEDYSRNESDFRIKIEHIDSRLLELNNIKKELHEFVQNKDIILEVRWEYLFRYSELFEIEDVHEIITFTGENILDSFSTNRTYNISRVLEKIQNYFEKKKGKELSLRKEREFKEYCCQKLIGTMRLND